MAKQRLVLNTQGALTPEFDCVIASALLSIDTAVSADVTFGPSQSTNVGALIEVVTSHSTTTYLTDLQIPLKKGQKVFISDQNSAATSWNITLYVDVSS